MATLDAAHVTAMEKINNLTADGSNDLKQVKGVFDDFLQNTSGKLLTGLNGLNDYMRTSTNSTKEEVERRIHEIKQKVGDAFQNNITAVTGLYTTAVCPKVLVQPPAPEAGSPVGPGPGGGKKKKKTKKQIGGKRHGKKRRGKKTKKRRFKSSRRGGQ